MDRDDDVDEDVVLGLRLHLDVELLHPQVDAPGDDFDERDLEVESRHRDAREFPEALHDGRRLLIYREDGAEKQRNDDQH